MQQGLPGILGQCPRPAKKKTPLAVLTGHPRGAHSNPAQGHWAIHSLRERAYLTMHIAQSALGGRESSVKPVKLSKCPLTRKKMRPSFGVRKCVRAVDGIYPTDPRRQRQR